MLSLPTLPCSSHKLVWPQQTSHAVFSQTLLQLPMAAANLSWAAADLSCSSNQSLKPCQCPFMEVPGCHAVSFYGGSRLPAASEQPPAPACSLGGRQCSALLFFLFGFSLRVFLGNVPLFVVTWFARWHVMLDLNAAT